MITIIKSELFGELIPNYTLGYVYLENRYGDVMAQGETLLDAYLDIKSIDRLATITRVTN